MRRNIVFHPLPLFLAFLLALSPSYLVAQRIDSLQRELTVVSEHQAVIEPRLPQDPLYRFAQPKVTQWEPSATPSEREFLPPLVIPRFPMLSGIASLPNYPDRVGAFSLYGGVGPNLLADFTLGVPVGKGGRFFAEATHRSYWHQEPYLSDNLTSVKRHTSHAKIGYSQRRDLAELNLWGAFDFDRYNFFALHPDLPSSFSKPQGGALSSPLEGLELMGSLGGNYARKIARGQLTLDGAVSFLYQQPIWQQNTSVMKPTRRLEVAFDAQYQYHLGGMWHLGVRTETDILSSGGYTEGIEGYYLASERYTNPFDKAFLFFSQGATPYLGVEGLVGAFPWFVHLGAEFTFSGYRKDFTFLHPERLYKGKLHVAPYLNAKVTFNKHIALFASAGGGVHIPDRFGDAAYNRFIAIGFPLMPERIRYEAELGVEVNPGFGLSMALSGGYRCVDGKNFLRIGKVIPLGTSLETPRFMAFIPFQGDSHIPFAKLRVGYQLYDKLTLQGSLVYRRPMTRGDDKAVMPEGIVPLETSFSISYRPLSELTLFANYFAGLGVKQQVEVAGEVRRASFSFMRASLGASYQFHHRFVLSATLSNPSFLPLSYPYGYRDSYSPFAFQVGGSVLF